MCRRSGSPPSCSQCSVSASSISAGPQTNVSRSRQSGHSSLEVGGRDAALLARQLLLAAGSRRGARRARAAGRRRSTSSSVRAECRCTTSCRPPSWSRLRSMLMIGVIPLPALMNSAAREPRRGARTSPPPRRGARSSPAWPRAPGTARPRRSRSSFGVMLMQPSGRPGSEVIEYARQWCMPSTTKPIRRYWPGWWPSHSQPGLMTTVTASVGLALDPLDPAAQLLGGPERVDQLEVVVGQQRREERAHRPQGLQAPGGDLRSGAALSHSQWRRTHSLRPSTVRQRFFQAAAASGGSSGDSSRPGVRPRDESGN